MTSTLSLTHLQQLEADSIHIMREVVAETDRPVMLYSIGKDSFSIASHCSKSLIRQNSLSFNARIRRGNLVR